MPTNINFAFDTKQQRYRYTSGRNKGKFVSEGKVRSILRSYLKQEKKTAQEKTQELFDGKVTLREWEKWQAERLKKNAIQMAKIGNPAIGTVATDPYEFSKIGNYLRSTYGYLRGFTNEIKSGELSQAQILARIGLYYEDQNYMAEESKRISHRKAGYQWERRILALAEHCSDCITYASMGWQPMGTLPAITTQCKCKANDKCYFEYSSSLLRPITESMSDYSQHRRFNYFQHGWLQ